MIPKSFIVGLSAVLFAYIFILWNGDSEDNLNKIESVVIDAWENQIKEPLKKFERLAVGINSNVDIILPGVPLLRKLGLTAGGTKDHDILNTMDDLQETFAHFFRKGSAAERTFSDPNVFARVMEATDSIENKELYIGGNAALMAVKASALFPDVTIQFVGPVGPVLKQLMPGTLNIPDASHISSDEYHLIMEYKVGEMWGSASAPVATRFISSYDYSNSRLTMLDVFFDSLVSFSPHLVLMSGLHMLDGQPMEFFEEKINLLSTRLREVPVSVPVHLELASMATELFVKDILHSVLRNVNSLGLNEQELVFAARAAGGPHGQDGDHPHGQPEIHKISDILLWLLTTFGQSEKNRDSRFSRVHFHSLTYHIIATVGQQWSNVESSLAAGTRVAGVQACNVSRLTADIVDIKIPLKYKLFTGDKERDFNPSSPVLVFSREGVNFVFSPVLVCKHPLKTVGLGDAISTTGLMFSQFTSS